MPANWKQKLITFAERFEHPAWGIAHFERVYDLSLWLAGEQKAVVDGDVLCAAAYLHDIGAFGPYRREGVDHAERSVQVVESILADLGFPREKMQGVKEVIGGHMFYEEPSSRTEAIIFHDADTLDFMGVIGITRVLSIVGLDDWTPDLRSAVELIRRFSLELPERLHTPLAREIGKKRQSEMEQFLASLSEQTRGLHTL